MKETIVPSAATILVRGESEPEVFLGLRAKSHRAFPSTYVFPGGKVEEGDRKVPVLDVPEGVAPEVVAAAARELYEEVGVLLARPVAGGVTDGDTAPPGRAAGDPRRRVLAGEIDFAGVLRAMGAAVDGRAFVVLGEKTTPPFARLRFKNRFFLARLPAGQDANVIPGELESGIWISPGNAVARFEAGDAVLAPPVLLLLETWGTGSLPEGIARMRDFTDAALTGIPLRIKFSPQVITFPGRTPTLPPATHTNTYLVGGRRFLVVDPATDDPEDRDKLLRLLQCLADDGCQPVAMVLTHHHQDHVAAVETLRGILGTPLWAHRITGDRIEADLDRELVDGDRIDLEDGGVVSVHHTPGHAQGHICLLQEKFGALIAGDMVSTVSTIVIDPPEGNMADYIASLKRLRTLPARFLYPSHGPPTPRVHDVIDHYLAHRAEREKSLLKALRSGLHALPDLVKVVYADVDEGLHPIAQRSLLAGLLKLRDEGQVREVAGGDWEVAGPVNPGGTPGPQD